MALILLDSSVIFDHLNQRFGCTEFLEELVAQGHLFACCAVNLTEDRPPSRTATPRLEDEGSDSLLHRCHNRGSGIRQRSSASYRQRKTFSDDGTSSPLISKEVIPLQKLKGPAFLAMALQPNQLQNVFREMLQPVFDLRRELIRQCAVDQTVIEAERQIHDRADRDGVVIDYDRGLFNRAYA